MDKVYEIKKSYLAMLIMIRDADHNYSEWEEQFIENIATRLSISKADMDLVYRNPKANITQLPETYAQRIEFFYNLLFLMGIDNNVNRQEIEMCRQIGFKLCFNPLLMEDLIQIIVDNLGRKVPVNDVIKAVLKYQN